MSQRSGAGPARSAQTVHGASRHQSLCEWSAIGTEPAPHGGERGGRTGRPGVTETLDPVQLSTTIAACRHPPGARKNEVQ